ncbi:MAG: ribose 5-phosphate isomerase B [Abditibacteriaceae bacterium]
MIIAIGGDHAGYILKEASKKWITDAGHEVLDFGTCSTEPVDYPDFASAVGHAVVEKRADRGIVMCGSGAGAAIAANKIRGIRAALAHETYTAHQAVEHDDVNVITLGERVIGVVIAQEIVETFLKAKFTGEERHLRRIGKIAKLEEEF